MAVAQTQAPASASAAPANEFRRTGALLVKDFLTQDLCRLLRDYVEFNAMTKGFEFNTEPTFVPDSLVFYGNPMTEALLKNYQPKVEELSGLDLNPTYSFMRFYKEGDQLPKHTDRLSCEISLSLCIGQSYDPAEYQWPLYVDGVPYNLAPGDAVIYRGIEKEHWRNRLEREWHLQFHLHYVDRRSAFAEDLKFDSRESLGHPKSMKRLVTAEYDRRFLEANGFPTHGRFNSDQH